MKSSDKSDKSIIKRYNPSEIESKWQKIWEKEKIYSPNLEKAAKPFYNLMMFPYPSAEGMHVGNMYAFTGADVYGRFRRMKGNDVFEPIGLDGFGIHSENYAIKVGKHPVEQSKISETNFYRQLKSIGNGFDWTRTVETYKPEYYKWTQWLFIQLFKAGLAYRKKAPVNFCPSCKTVLSDEQVVTKLKVQSEKLKVAEEINVCERCETEIEKRNLEQWFFKITKYADRLLSNLSQIDWAEKVKTAQKLWIGKSEGVMLHFKVKDMDIYFEMFDSVPQTFMAQTFTVIAPEHPMVYELVKGTGYEKPVMGFVKTIKKKKSANKYDLEKKPEGIFTGRYLEYTPTGKLIPIWVASYAIYGYGTGIVNCSVHDERDFIFAKEYNIPLHPVMFPSNLVLAERVRNLEICYHHEPDGILQEPTEFKGRKWREVREDIIRYIENKNYGKRQAQYHLRDWLISRQRYWGPPIPLVFCENCAVKIKNQKSKFKDKEYSEGEMENPGWIPVPDDQLPVELPFIKDYKPLGTGKAPLASHPEFYKTKCPKCGEEAKRETDVSDTFLDSSWYFLRYLAADRKDIPFPMKNSKFEARNSKQIQNSNVRNSKQFRISDFDIRAFAQRARWLPVSMYIGGAEHSVLHLLYSRFITMALKDMGLISFEEPFTKFRAHGLIIKDGAKMSKSKGNVVIPDAYIKKFGADSLRAYLMFSGPFSQGGDFRDSGIEGMHRFLNRVWRLASENSKFKIQNSKLSEERLRMMHKTIKKVTEDISNLSYNTAIAALMEWYNFLNQKSKIKDQKLPKEEIETFLKLLAPFAPHMTEELYHNVILKAKPEGSHEILRYAQNDKSFSSIHLEPWSSYDPKFLAETEMVIAIQINGKLRDTLKVQSSKFKIQSEIEQLARESAKVKKYLDGRKILKVIYIEGKVINFAIS